MKATFLYSNAKTFTVKNIVEDSIKISRLPRKGLPDLVTLVYSAHVSIPVSKVAELLDTLPVVTDSGSENGITSELRATGLWCDVDTIADFTIPATETGLLYVLITPEWFDMDDNPSSVGVAVVPVLDKKLDSLVLADCIACMI